MHIFYEVNGVLINMKFKAFVYVSLKLGYSDPEGETTAEALRGLGYPVETVRSSKAYEVYYEADNKKNAENLIDEMCRRLLTNPIKDDYRYELSEA
jgi:phosphoribosylformylglycinamidine synthase